MDMDETVEPKDAKFGILTFFPNMSSPLVRYGVCIEYGAGICIDDAKHVSFTVLPEWLHDGEIPDDMTKEQMIQDLIALGYTHDPTLDGANTEDDPAD